MPMIAEEHSEESLRNFSQGTEQVMKTTMSRHATTDEGEFQPKEELEEAGDMPAREMAAATLPQKEVGQQFSGETVELKFAA
jgi:hypothetical protein